MSSLPGGLYALPSEPSSYPSLRAGAVWYVVSKLIYIICCDIIKISYECYVLGFLSDKDGSLLNIFMNGVVSESAYFYKRSF